MRTPTPVPASRIAELNEFRKGKWLGNEFQRFLCVWLRVEQGMTTTNIAGVLGWNVNTVRIIQKQFIDHGIQAITELKRGGRNHALMTPEEEKEFLSSFEAATAGGGILVANEISNALETRLGRKVHKTTIYRMLHRNGWRKISPRPTHPKRNSELAEAFKKGASQKGYPVPKTGNAFSE